jgi:hypothetical protein
LSFVAASAECHSEPFRSLSVTGVSFMWRSHI